MKKTLNILKRNKLNEAPLSFSKKRFGKERWNLSNDEKIQYAIENCYRIKITYDDKKGGKGKNTRYLLPLVYGITKNGKKAIRAFQTFGSTKRGTPSYKLFLFDNIGKIEVGRIKYNSYEQELLNTGFNNAGDKSFATIYAITPLARNFNSASLVNKNKPIDAEPVQKTDINPKQQEKQPTPAKTNIQQIKQPTNIKKTNISIDKNGQNDYSSKINAPDTKPVTKADIAPKNSNNNGEENNLNVPSTSPVEKGDIEKPNINKNNKLTNSYNDMMQRMDNLYKDEDEEEKEM